MIDWICIILFTILNIMWVGIIIGARHYKDKIAMAIAVAMLIFNTLLIVDSAINIYTDYTEPTQVEVIE